MNSNFYIFIINYFPLIFYSAFWLFICLYLLKGKFINRRFLIFSLLVFVFVNLLVVLSRALFRYLSLSSDEWGKYLLPPYSDFYLKEITRLVSSSVISALFVLILYFVLLFFSQKTRQEIIDAQDVFLISFASLILGWPNFLIFLFLLFIITFFGSILAVIFKKKNKTERFIITYYIPLSFLIVLWLGNYLAELTLLYKIRF